MDNQISTLLREVKESTDWTESQIAERLGVSQPTVSRILNGQTDCKSTTYRAISALHAAHVTDGDLSTNGAKQAVAELSVSESSVALSPS